MLLVCVGVLRRNGMSSSVDETSEGPIEQPIASITRVASCCCGEFKLTCVGNPIKISMCHCFACQQRTGSVFGVQARFAAEQIVSMEGEFTTYRRVGDDGMEILFKFCPKCGSTVTYTFTCMPDLVAVAVGCFKDPKIGMPVYSVYEARKHDWIELPSQMEHHD